MLIYVARRLVVLLPTALGVLVLAFVILRIIPGDPVSLLVGEGAPPEHAARMRRQLGLDQPVHVQFVRFAAAALRLDLGRSLNSNNPVTEEIFSRYPHTLELVGAATVIAVAAGTAAGAVSAVRAGTAAESVVMILALVGLCTPHFWLGLMLIVLFAIKLNWFPVAGVGGVAYLVLPALTLSTSFLGIMARQTRSAVLDVLAEDYVRTARAKGLAEWTVVSRHALRNALIPVVTIMGLQVGRLLGGSVVTEVVFNRPGLGRLVVQAVGQRDYPVVQGVVFFVALTVLLINLVVDVSYGLINPRVRYA
ncbi:MAG: ABC transporter permease [Armatimonadetes bacterium]|nr:ABC transporter permease [Armatimonadota bacterium]